MAINANSRKAHAPAAGRRKEKPRQARIRPVFQQFDNVEDILINLLLNSRQRGGSTAVYDILYSMTQSTSNIGYLHGFSVGRRMALAAGGKNHIPDILEKRNFGKVIYQPLQDRLSISSTATPRLPLSIKKNIHVYEAGIIAGYMSTATGTRLSAVETRCTFNESDFCHFVCSPYGHRVRAVDAGSASVIASLAEAISRMPYHDHGISYDYSTLHIMPLIREPLLLHEVSAIMHLAGARLATGVPKTELEPIAEKIGASIGIRNVSVGTLRAEKAIRIKYGPYNSTEGFLKFSAQPFIGFATRLLGSRASIYKTINQDKTYTLSIELTRI
ncbi:MAG: 4-vinyl reductase [Candidatus Micrarchaeota archaeon]|nr:4-vinyl reductase [Candidatus Micrarchaeota archaeon]